MRSITTNHGTNNEVNTYDNNQQRSNSNSNSSNNNGLTKSNFFVFEDS